MRLVFTFRVRIDPEPRHGIAETRPRQRAIQLDALGPVRFRQRNRDHQPAAIPRRSAAHRLHALRALVDDAASARGQHPAGLAADAVRLDPSRRPRPRDRLTRRLFRDPDSAHRLNECGGPDRASAGSHEFAKQSEQQGTGAAGTHAPRSGICGSGTHRGACRKGEACSHAASLLNRLVARASSWQPVRDGRRRGSARAAHACVLCRSR